MTDHPDARNATPMTIDPDRRLAHYLTNEPPTVQRIADALENEAVRVPGRLSEALAFAINGHHGNTEDGVEAVQILGDALRHVQDLARHAGPPASLSTIELLLDAEAVSRVVLTHVDALAEDLAQVLRTAGAKELPDGRFDLRNVNWLKATAHG